MIRLLAMDGLNLIRRIYAVHEHNFNQNANTENLLHNVTQDCKSAVTKLLQQFQPTHAVMVFDGEKDNWRRQLFSDYKANRKPMPDLLFKHLDDIQDAFMQLGVDSLLAESDEADDLIASLVEKIPADRGESIIVSSDKDYLQLLTKPNVQIWHHFNKQWLDRDYVQEKFAVPPEKLVSFFSLTGDSGHNITGIKGIGAKLASKLLSEKDFDEVLNDNQLQEKYRFKGDEIKLYQLLFSLKQDIKLEFHLRDIRVVPH